MTKDEAITVFGFDPETMCNRPRGWYVIDKLDDLDRFAQAEIGYLCVKSRDGASNEVCLDAYDQPNFHATIEDSFDTTYRYYYFCPLAPSEEAAK